MAGEQRKAGDQPFQAVRESDREPGPTTGGRPIYDGRFNVQARKPLEEERLDI